MSCDRQKQQVNFGVKYLGSDQELQMGENDLHDGFCSLKLAVIVTNVSDEMTLQR